MITTSARPRGRPRSAALWRPTGGGCAGCGFRAVLVEPGVQIELRAQIVRWCAGRAVVLVVEPDQRGRDATKPERAIELLGLWHRRAQIENSGHQDRRSLHVTHVHDR